MSILGFTGVALSAVLLIVALLTASLPIAYMALSGIVFVLLDAYRTITHPKDPLV
jgi:hypothetical protein